MRKPHTASAQHALTTLLISMRDGCVIWRMRPQQKACEQLESSEENGFLVGQLSSTRPQLHKGGGAPVAVDEMRPVAENPSHGQSLVHELGRLPVDEREVRW